MPSPCPPHLRPAPRRSTSLGLAALCALFALWPLPAGHAAADLFVRDTPADTGVEPNPDPGPMYVSEDIWVRNAPDPNYLPDPFPTATPTWTPQAHQNPEYRDPRLSVPSFVYVRVSNRGTTPSTGTERLRVYWAKASTGLSWPNQWVDYMANTCGPSRLFGIELTKPRKNAATASAAERDAYIAAIQGIDALTWSDLVSYWDRQDQIHQLAPEHGNPAFLPWHREFIHRYEVLLREVNPLVTLLYWDWTTNPTNSAGFNFFSATFMGLSGAGGSCGVRVGAPFGTFDANSVCANGRAQPSWANDLFNCPPADCGANLNNWQFPPPVIKRRLNSGAPPATSDATTLGILDYPGMSFQLEDNSHNDSHVFLGGSSFSGSLGNMSRVAQASEDPFFFLLHANCDRLWAQWQRDVAHLDRLASSTAYGTDGTHAKITGAMAPWNGASAIFPWTGAGGHIVNLAPTNAAVVAPPIYDTAPLVIPVLGPNESVVIQIPWHPPNPADFACFGDPGHFCLLARIETAVAAPFGMTTPEGANVGTNTRNNNNIAWKNLTVVDNFAGAAGISSLALLRNVAEKPRLARLAFTVPEGERRESLFEFGTLTAQLDPELFKRWVAGGRRGEKIDTLGENLIFVGAPDAFIDALELRPGEAFAALVQFRLRRDYPHPAGRIFNLDVTQLDRDPEQPNENPAFTGGQRFSVDFNKLVLVPAGAEWQFLDDGSVPNKAWITLDFDARGWKRGRAELGFGDDPVTLVEGGPPAQRHITTYFRRVFEVEDPSFFRHLVLRLKRDDGAVVYLNGEPIEVANLPAREITADTPATVDVDGAAEDVFYPSRPNEAWPKLLRQGRNVIAVEIHQAAKDSPDLTFDLELCANVGDVPIPPELRFVGPGEGEYFQADGPITVTLDAVDPDGQVKGVGLYLGDRLIGEAGGVPATFVISNRPPGRLVLTATAGDDQQNLGLAQRRLVVVPNLAPLVRITSPAEHEDLRCAPMLHVRAEATDPGGQIESVEFFARDAEFFGAKDIPLGKVAGPPFEVQTTGLPGGMYRLFAVARDSKGLAGRSAPVHIMVADTPVLSIAHSGQRIRLSWETPDVQLETAPTVLGPWTTLSGVGSPLELDAAGAQQYFRLRCGAGVEEPEGPPRIDPPLPDHRLPLDTDPQALPRDARAVLPAFDGDPLFVTLPGEPRERLTTQEVYDETIVPILKAIGFDRRDAIQLPPDAGVTMPRAKFAGLADAVADEYARVPKLLGPRTAEMLEVFLGRKPATREIDQALEMGEGMNFSQFVANVERAEIQYPFLQVDRGVPLEHTLLVASRWDGFGIHAVRGSLLRQYRILNQPELTSPDAVVKLALEALRNVPGIERVRDQAPEDGPHLVLLPYGTDANGLAVLRYAHRLILRAWVGGDEGPFLLWLDAQTAAILKLDPLFNHAVAEGAVWNRDPGVGTTTGSFQVDPAVGGQYTLRLSGVFERLDYRDDGYNADDVSIPDNAMGSSATFANFNQAPLNNAAQALCDAGTNPAFQQIHFFAVLYRHYAQAISLGIFTPFPTVPWVPRIEVPGYCNGCSTMRFGACQGYFDAACDDFSTGAIENENFMNFAHDNTWIGHELGHNISIRFLQGRPADWCGMPVCAIPVGWSSRLHDLADFWGDHFESCNFFSGWSAKNQGGVDAALYGVANHSEGGYGPRLHRVTVPFNPADPGDHFPEHRALASGGYADMQMGTVALWEVRLGMRSKCRPSGVPQFAVRYARALRNSTLNPDPGGSDRGIYSYLYDLERELTVQWATAGSPGGPPAFAHNGAHTTSKVTAGFARAGLFLIPPQQLDGDPGVPDNGADAVIDIDDTNPADDYDVNGVAHRETDFLELGGPAPLFHVWTGPRYRLDGPGGAATFSNPAPCNTQFQVEVSTDPAFAPAATVTSAWQPVDTDPTTPASPEGYGTWSPSRAEWANLQAGGAGTLLYYRARTRDAANANERLSTEPGNGLWTVPAPYAVITADGRSDY